MNRAYCARCQRTVRPAGNRCGYCAQLVATLAPVDTARASVSEGASARQEGALLSSLTAEERQLLAERVGFWADEYGLPVGARNQLPSHIMDAMRVERVRTGCPVLSDEQIRGEVQRYVSRMRMSTAPFEQPFAAEPKPNPTSRMTSAAPTQTPSGTSFSLAAEVDTTNFEQVSVEEFLRRTAGGRTNQMDTSAYVGHPYHCACGETHIFEGRTTAVLRELAGMRLVLRCQNDSLTCVKVKGILRFTGFESLFGSQSGAASSTESVRPSMASPRQQAPGWGSEWSDRISGFVILIAAAGAIRFFPGLLLKAAVGALAGALLGYLPYALARRRGRERFGGVALATCALVGVFGGLLIAVPASAGLTLYLLFSRGQPVSRHSFSGGT